MAVKKRRMESHYKLSPQMVLDGFEYKHMSEDIHETIQILRMYRKALKETLWIREIEGPPMKQEEKITTLQKLAAINRTMLKFALERRDLGKLRSNRAP